MNINEELKICVEINEKEIYSFNEKVNEQKIIETASKIEKLLLENGANHTKIKSVYEITIEMLQNILNYSYDSSKVENNKMEANGYFGVCYSTQKDNYNLKSCNLIEKVQEEIIINKIDSIKNLDDKELRKLAREKMRSKEDNHDKGAGLGFIMMQRKSTQPIAIEFVPFKDEIVQFKLKLIL